VDVGALRPTDQRLRRKTEDADPSAKKIRQGTLADDDDSDWD
jgi:hypothetical protein